MKLREFSLPAPVKKVAGKVIPGVGAAASAADAVSRARKGDYVGAAISGAGAVPILSIPAMAVQAGRDKMRTGQWFPDEEPTNEDDTIATTAHSQRILRKLRGLYPQARSDIEALLLHLDNALSQDREDIGRLDYENDQEDAAIDRLDHEVDTLQRITKANRVKEVINPALSFEEYSPFMKEIRPIKLKIKQPKMTAQEKLYKQHQELRKKSGLPDPDHYKKLAAKLQKELDDLKRKGTTEGLLPGEYHHFEIAIDPKTGKKKRVYKGVRGEPHGPTSWGDQGAVQDRHDREARAHRQHDRKLREFAPGDGSDRSITWEQLVNFMRRTLDSFGFGFERSQGFAEYNRGRESLRLKYDPSDSGWFGWALGEYAGDFNVLYSGTDLLTIESAENVLEYVNKVFGFEPKGLDEGGFDIPEIPRQTQPKPTPNKGMSEEAKKGLYYYVNKRKKAGTSRPKGHPKAPSAQDWKDAAKTAKTEDVAEDALDDRITAQYNTPQMKAKSQAIDQAFASGDQAEFDRLGIVSPQKIERDYQTMRAKEPAQDAALRKTGMKETGPFSYGAKKRQQQERGKQPAEPRDYMVGVARVKKDVEEAKTRLDPKCWTGYKKQGTKMKGGVRVNNCVPKE